MANQEQTQYPSYVQPQQDMAFPQQGYSQPPINYPQPPINYPQPPINYPQPPIDYPQPPINYPQPPINYPQPPTNYPQPPTGYPQPPTGYPQPPTGYPQPPTGYPQESTAYPQGSVNNPAEATYGQPPAIPDVAVAASHEEDEEDTAIDCFIPSVKTSWQAFMIRVYGILTVQLAFLDGIIALCHFSPGLKSRLTTGNTAFTGVVFGILFLSLAFCKCCNCCKRNGCINVIVLPILTISMGFFLGTISSLYDNYLCLISVGISSSSCLVVALLSFHPKFDFNVCDCRGTLFIVAWVIFVSGIITFVTYEEIQIYMPIVAGVGSAFFMSYLSHNTMLMTTSGKNDIKPEESTFVVLTLYFDICVLTWPKEKKKPISRKTF